MVNHFTIALLSVAVFLDILGRLLQNDKYHFVAWINLFLGTTGVFTVITGLLARGAYRTFRCGTRSHERPCDDGFYFFNLVNSQTLP
ncbi:MAG: hypothetical protein EH225_01610 [Calditrichaeota bacterium]|nr:hypothetical protein [Calditrichota bacterium]RQW07552.1 MAG: hypothetical protein EH225_01610 [Calditrichota bacterium]